MEGEFIASYMKNPTSSKMASLRPALHRDGGYEGGYDSGRFSDDKICGKKKKEHGKQKLQDEKWRWIWKRKKM